MDPHELRHRDGLVRRWTLSRSHGLSPAQIAVYDLVLKWPDELAGLDFLYDLSWESEPDPHDHGRLLATDGRGRVASVVICCAAKPPDDQPFAEPGRPRDPSTLTGRVNAARADAQARFPGAEVRVWILTEEGLVAG